MEYKDLTTDQKEFIHNKYEKIKPELVDWALSDYSNPYNGHEYVDMGEAGIWAKYNIGAISEFDPGMFFSWGETQPKDSYTENNYKFGITGNFTKYNNVDGLTTIELEDDAVHVYMGGNWRIPSPQEWQKLVDLCDMTGYEHYNIFTLKSDKSKYLVLPRDSKYVGGVNGDGYGGNGGIYLSNNKSKNSSSFTTFSFDRIGSISTYYSYPVYFGYTVRGFFDPNL